MEVAASGGRRLSRYVPPMPNLDPQTVEGFGDEWTTCDQSEVSSAELDELFERYFRIFPWSEVDERSVGFDLGCGSGRWAVRVAPRVGWLHCIDPSPASLSVAARALSREPNVDLHEASVDAMPLAEASMDFGYCLGVLHHVPDTGAGIRSCVQKLKPGAPLLLYLYYAFDNRPRWFRALWRASDLARRAVSGMPHRAKVAFALVVAVLVYWPLARLSALLERARRPVEGMPLSYYRASSLYTMRTDALDRFGTRLEQRFSAEEIIDMMTSAGLREVHISPEPPHWCAIGRRDPGQVTEALRRR